MSFAERMAMHGAVMSSWVGPIPPVVKRSHIEASLVDGIDDGFFNVWNDPCMMYLYTQFPKVVAR